LEINGYARELAQVVVWIGYLKWKVDNGFPGYGDPVLEPLETIRLQDALLDLSDPEQPKEAAWPAADFIIGNPPFLGAKRLRAELGDEYTEILHRVYAGRFPPFADLVCYFFEKARSQIERGGAKRAGLLATNSIRGGSNRAVLDRIKETGDIFMAWEDEPWVLDGAAVRISIVGFDDGSEGAKTLNGVPAASITSALTSGVDLAGTQPLAVNAGICFLGVQLSGPFDLSGDLARTMLAMPLNPNGRPNSDVIKPLINGIDITRRPRDVWIVDFGVGTTEDEAALYEAPFEYVREHVKPMRAASRSQLRDSRWWLTLWPRPEMRTAVGALERYLATPTVAKHRVFAWFASAVLPNHQVVVFARQDDYFFGVLHSRAHEVWSLRMGTSLEDRPRYTPTTCFETFPLPWPPGQETWRDEHLHAIAEAAHALDEARGAWLNPEGATDAELKKRTLTNLYNERPTWLTNLHAALDRAVWAAYGWDDAPGETSDEQVLERLLALNGERDSDTTMRW
jgi:type II restriction/modification system DNA methylase subunit YeeA